MNNESQVNKFDRSRTLDKPVAGFLRNTASSTGTHCRSSGDSSTY
jgi:hypothetical protein